MRIGLFTDSYHPSTNGITVVVDTMKKNLEMLGHEVYVVAPAASLRFWSIKEKHVIRFAAIRGLFFDEFLTSVFFPPRQLRRIRGLKLDAVLIFTPAQIGLMGAYYALSDDVPLLSQYSTDLTEYVERYPAVMPGVLALYASMPFALKSKPKELYKFTRNYTKNSKESPLSWRQYSIQKTLTFLHDRCDAVISVSPKITELLKSWGTSSQILTIPTGVDLGTVDTKKVEKFRARLGLKPTDKVLLSLGRVAEEKNLDLLIEAMPHIIASVRETKLIIAGGFSYREVLEKKAVTLGLDKHIIFTGHIPIAERWGVYSVADVFCFPSLTDTQALVVNEAALMSLPILWCDNDVNEVMIDGQTGLHCKNSPISFAKSAVKLLNNPTLARDYGINAKKRALKLSEKVQTQKIEKAILTIIKSKQHI